MIVRNKWIGAVAFMSAFFVDTVVAQVGKPFIHDPSTIVECEGKYYTFGTGGGGLISEDGWTWNSGAVRPGGGAAPDVVRIGDRYLVAYGATGGGLGGGHNGVIYTMWNKTLDPQSPDFGYSEPVAVASSDAIEDNDAIDPGFCWILPMDGCGCLMALILALSVLWNLTRRRENVWKEISRWILPLTAKLRI